MKTGKRVLALNDDNHDTSFITEDGQYFLTIPALSNFWQLRISKTTT